MLFSFDVDKEVGGSSILKALDLAGIAQNPKFGKRRMASSLRAIFSPFTPSSPGCQSPSIASRAMRRPVLSQLGLPPMKARGLPSELDYIYGYVSKTDSTCVDPVTEGQKAAPSAPNANGRARGHRRSKTEPAKVFLEFLVTLDEESTSPGELKISPAPGQSAQAAKLLAGKMVRGHRRTKSDISSVMSRGMLMEDVCEDAELQTKPLPKFAPGSILGDGNALMSGSAINQIMEGKEEIVSRRMPKGPLAGRAGQRVPMHRRVASDPAFLRSAMDLEFALVDETPPTTAATTPTPPPMLLSPTGDGLLGVSPKFVEYDPDFGEAVKPNYCFNCRGIGHVSKSCPLPCSYCKQVLFFFWLASAQKYTKNDTKVFKGTDPLCK